MSQPDPKATPKDRGIQTELEAFLRSYGEAASSQSPNEAEYDSEIKHITLALTEALRGTETGTLIDLGCGAGILLKRLSTLDAFTASGWIYACVDYDERVTEVLKLAAELRLNRRVEGVSLPDFYSKWGSGPLPVPRPFLIVVRNVLHELNIPKTAQLIQTCASLTRPGESLIFQDLQVFPEAERGNVCWHPSFLKLALAACGFECVPVAEVSPRGNRWFSLLARRADREAITLEKAQAVVQEQRRAQYQFWLELGELAPKDKEYRQNTIAVLDFDLQRFALLTQLNQAAAPGLSPPTKTQQAIAAKQVFSKDLGSFHLADLQQSSSPLPRVTHFRDRARDQDEIELFLRSDAAILLVRGGSFMGKSVLVSEVLARRAHGRQPVLLDPQLTSSVWNLLEQYLGGIGCRISYALISGSRTTTLTDVLEPLAKLVKWTSKHTVVVFDHFERLLDPAGEIVDREIYGFLQLLTGHPQAKVIVTSQREPLAGSFDATAAIHPNVLVVGRFPVGKHVENILDDFVDRKKCGIGEYPDDLIAAIDRYPYLAVLAANIIRNEGREVLSDQTVLANIRERMRADLLRRLVSDQSRKAIELLSLIRIAVPRKMLVDLAGTESVAAAEETGLLYCTFDRFGRDLMTGADLLRATPDEDDTPPQTFADVAADLLATQRLIADWYERLYREDDDPRWLRELYYHRLLVRDENEIYEFGVAYRTELFRAGDYWFRRLKDFRLALKAFEAAERLGLKTYLSQMRLAACLIRVNRRPEGERRYQELIDLYPHALGVKLSFIDSLLFIRAYSSAIDKLDQFGLRPNEAPWVAGEYGRARFGMHQYPEAIGAFETQLKMQPDAIAFWMLARAYHRDGQRDEVARVLEKGLKRYPQNRHLLLSYAAHLVGLGPEGDAAKAEAILRELFEKNPNNGAVLHQLCKLLCLQDRTGDAQFLYQKHRGRLYPERYEVPIEVELCLARKNWAGALGLLADIDANDGNLVGLKKKVYLYWARAEGDPAKRAKIANEGLEFVHAPSLSNDVPIMVTCVKLARLADTPNRSEALLTQLERRNASVAAMLRETPALDAATYWEEDPLEPPQTAEGELEGDTDDHPEPTLQSPLGAEAQPPRAVAGT